jgi:ABC-2 type transport system ATP-binding protein
MIEVENLTRYYGPVRAVYDVNFQVERGEIVGFLGPNGAGKSTTMRILTGYLPASAGTARVAGFDVFYDSLEVRRRVGYMPETVPLYPEMTVQAYLNYMAELRQLPDTKKAVRRAMEACDVTGRAHQPIKELSKGYRQRVGLAQAILHEPEVLILDEPTIGLDPRQVADVRQLVRDIGQEHTVILSSHILSEVSQTCNRIIIISEGQIVASGTPEELTAQVQETDRVKVLVSGADAPQVTELLGRVDGVLDIETDADGAYVVSSTQGHDNHAEIARAVVEQGWDLLELGTLGMSLEEIFLKVTEGVSIEELTGAPSDEESGEIEEEIEREEEEHA